MANQWPDGERPLSKTETWLIGIGAVVLVAAGLIYLGLMIAGALHLRLPLGVSAALGLGALTLAIAWVQPWNQTPPVRRPRRPAQQNAAERIRGPWGA